MNSEKDNQTNGCASFVSPDYIPGLVSVIIPTYNRAALVTDAILSALKQTYLHVEAIVIDDGSGDNTCDVVQALVERYGPQRLRYMKQANLGAPSARNHGVQMSKGEFIQYLDSDDLLEPDKHQREVSLLLRHPAIDMAYSDIRGVYQETGKTRFRVRNAPRDPLAWVLGKQTILCHTSSWLWRRKAVLTTGPWDERLLCWQDWELLARFLIAGGKVARIPAYGARYRIGIPGSIGSSKSRERDLSQVLAWQKIAALLEKKGFHDRYWSALAQTGCRLGYSLLKRGEKALLEILKGDLTRINSLHRIHPWARSLILCLKHEHGHLWLWLSFLFEVQITRLHKLCFVLGDVGTTLGSRKS